jgi:hypothetical protein
MLAELLCYRDRFKDWIRHVSHARWLADLLLSAGRRGCAPFYGLWPFRTMSFSLVKYFKNASPQAMQRAH